MRVEDEHIFYRVYPDVGDDRERLMAEMQAVSNRVWEGEYQCWRVPKRRRRELRAIWLRWNPRQVRYDLKRETPLHQRQLDALSFCAEHPSALLDHYMGAGKTRTGIELIGAKGARRALIVAPVAALTVWREQFAQWAPYPYQLLVLGGWWRIQSRAAKLEALTAGPPPKNTTQVVLINYEAVWRPPMPEALMETVFDIALIDEGHRIRRYNSKVSRFMGQLGPRIPHRYVLTGTPLPHTILDAFGIYRFLQPSVFGLNYRAFRSRYCDYDTFSRRIMGWRNTDEFRQLYNTLRHHVSREEIGIEPATINMLPVALKHATWKKYQQMERDFLVTLEDTQVVEAPNVLSRYLRLRQIESEFTTLDDGTVKRLAPLTVKQSILRDFLRDFPLDEKLVIFADFVPEVEQIIEIGGDLYEQQRNFYQLTGACKEVDEWKADVSGAVLVASLGAGSEAVDLTAASYALFWSLSLKLSEFEQAVARVNRPGQTRTPVVYIMIPEGPHGQQSIGKKLYRAHVERRNLLDVMVGDKEKEQE